MRPELAIVYLDSADLGGLRRLGTLRPAGKSVDAPVGFAYDPTWTQAADAFVVDPAHYLDTAPQYPASGQLAAIFTDAAPDRWGRMLLDYREAERARAERRKPRQLGEWDYLLGVNDELRMGGLRFATADSGPFLEDDAAAVPPVAELRELEAAAKVIEDPGRRSEVAVRDALQYLLAPGSPMGGARPKTSFRDASGDLWMAKFPSHNDRRDVGAWEYVLNRLASRAGIEVPEVDLRVFVGPYRTFLARRFDRSGGSRRLFASAMTLLGRRDRQESSYVEIAEAIRANGAPDWLDEDLEQLFRRLVFNILTGHRDDHLRNHGFLRTVDGWRLSPAYDLNPTPEKAHHELAIGISEHSPRLEVAVVETAPFCRLSESRASEIALEVGAAVADWRRIAEEINIPALEIEAVSTAFVEGAASAAPS